MEARTEGRGRGKGRGRREEEGCGKGVERVWKGRRYRGPLRPFGGGGGGAHRRAPVFLHRYLLMVYDVGAGRVVAVKLRGRNMNKKGRKRESSAFQPLLETTNVLRLLIRHVWLRHVS